MNMIMKNTFKHIVASVAFYAAALACGVSAIAQNLPTGVYLETDGICYRKTATHNPDNTYTIDIESFVKGKVTYTESADPCDIVLVLDVSGSMNQDITSYSYSSANVSTITGVDYLYDNFWREWSDESTTDYWYLYGDSHYQVNVGRARRGGYGSNTYEYFLFIVVNGTTLYINNQGQIVDTRPNNVTNYNSNLLHSSVQLYTRTPSSSITKINALKNACYSFITEVAKNAKYDKKGNLRVDEKGKPAPLDHRIAIVKFAGYDDDNVIFYNGNADAFVEAGEGNDKGNHRTRDGINYNEVVRGLKSVLTDSTDLKTGISGLVAGGATAADHGMHLAQNIINHIAPDRFSNKTVVFFTDGEPNHYRNFDSSVADDAIFSSYAIKSKTYVKTVKDEDGNEKTEESHPVVFSVGVFSGNEDTRTPDYMNYISSNYPDAQAMDNTGDKASSDFYKNASGGAANLSAIFKAIAGSAASSDANIGNKSVVTVDVVANSFNVPANAEDAELEILVAPCTGVTKIPYNGETKEYLTFGTAQTPSDAGLPDITYTIDPENNKITTSGFDYSAHFCGLDDSKTPPEYVGYKQIIRFKINLRDDAVGGPNVETNEESSGIYVDGKQVAEFNKPTVKIPVQIWIQKQGLTGDDSAVFTLESCPFEGFNFDDYEANTWTKITKIIVNAENMVEVTDDKGNKVKVVKQSGLDPDYFYRIREDAWAFGYQYQDGGVKYTVGDNVKNPFVIVNTRKDVVFDEAVYRNIFNEKTED